MKTKTTLIFLGLKILEILGIVGLVFGFYYLGILGGKIIPPFECDGCDYFTFFVMGTFIFFLFLVSIFLIITVMILIYILFEKIVKLNWKLTKKLSNYNEKRGKSKSGTHTTRSKRESSM